MTTPEPSYPRARAWVALALATLLACLGAGWGTNFLVSAAATTSAGGAQGPQGPAGEAGAAGPPGPAGEPGPSGAKGATGPEGPQGAAGARGAQGPQGAKGAPGTPGAPGATGPQGAAGPTGPTGETGDAGEVGETGDPGPVGVRGASGPKGAQGPQGQQGTTGPTGAAGSGRVVTTYRQATDSGTLSSGPLMGLAPGVWVISSSMYLDVPDASKYECELSIIVDGNQTNDVIARGEFVEAGTETFVTNRVVETLPGQTVVFETECALALGKKAHSMLLSTTATAAVLQGVGG